MKNKVASLSQNTTKKQLWRSHVDFNTRLASNTHPIQLFWGRNQELHNFNQKRKYKSCKNKLWAKQTTSDKDRKRHPYNRRALPTRHPNAK